MVRSSKVYGFVAKRSRTPLIFLSDLEAIRIQLVELTSLKELVEEAAKIVQQKLSSQTTAIFLFEKEDFMKRVAFVGFDQDGRPIEPSWLSEESYKRGVGFTGRAIVFNKTERTTDIYRECDDPMTRDQYLSKLGLLEASIVVPLLGSNHPFGALRVINQSNDQNQPIPGASFTAEDEYWITTVGSYLATAISELREKRKQQIYDNLITLNTNPTGEDYPNDTLSQIAADLVSELTPYKACIIRTVNHDGKLVIAAKAPTQDESFTWVGKDTEPRIPGQGIVGEVYATRTEQIHEKADDYRDKLINPAWFEVNRLESFACYPLLVEGNAVGTVSLFTQFVHEFSVSEIEHFQRLSLLIAKLVMKIFAQDDNEPPLQYFELPKEEMDRIEAAIDAVMRQRKTSNLSKSSTSLD